MLISTSDFEGQNKKDRTGYSSVDVIITLTTFNPTIVVFIPFY